MTVVAIGVDTGGTGGAPWSKILERTSPLKLWFLNIFFWTFIIFMFSNTSKIKWAKSEETSEFWGKRFGFTCIRPLLSKLCCQNFVGKTKPSCQNFGCNQVKTWLQPSINEMLFAFWYLALQWNLSKICGVCFIGFGLKGNLAFSVGMLQ